MMDSDFIDITKFIISEIEGGYVNHPDDRGMDTIFGISSRYFPEVYNYVVDTLKKVDYDKSLKTLSHSFLDFLKTGQTRTYKEYKIFMDIFIRICNFYYNEFFVLYDYYLLNGLSGKTKRYSFALCALLYDTAINIGLIATNKIFQKSLSDVSENRLVIDGIIGSKTQSVYHKYINSKNNLLKKIIRLYNCIYNYRVKHYHKIVASDSSQQVFLDGWLNRCSKINEYILNNIILATNNLFL